MKREPLEGRDSLAFLVHYRVLDKRQAPPTYPWSEWVVVKVAQSCLTLCDPMNRSLPGLPVHPSTPLWGTISRLLQPCLPLREPPTIVPGRPH